MISTGRNYTAFSPKKTKTGKTMFNLMDYDRNNPNAKRYITVFCQNDVEVFDRAKVTIEAIGGVSIGEYNGRQTVSMFADIKLADVEEFEKDFETGNKVEISDDDLPF